METDPVAPNRALIIAEMGANHTQKLAKAQALVRAAKWAGADAVKVQMYAPEQMTVDSREPQFRITDGPWSGQTLFELYRKACMPVEWVPDLKALAEGLGLTFIASIYHPDMIPTALFYGVEVLKVSSFECGWEFFLEKLASARKPVILSTGTADLAEIEAAVAVLGKENIMALLRCVSQYPAPPAAANLRTIPDLRDRFGVPVGLSDHSIGMTCALAAVALGATVIEKHLKLDGDDACLDAAFSATPYQFALMVDAIRETETALGRICYEPASTRYKRKEVNGVWVRTAN